MKKNSILICLLIIFALVAAPAAWPKSAFKFPSRIQYKLFKNNKFEGHCVLTYAERIGKEVDNKKLSSLKLNNFQAFGTTYGDNLHTIIFHGDLSLYLDTVMKGRDVVLQNKIGEGIGIDGKKNKIFMIKGKKFRGDIQTELFARYKVVNFISSSFVASHRVASGKYKNDALFYLILGKNIKIVRMRYKGRERVPYQGKRVTAEVISLTDPNNNDTEIFRLEILKSSDGYCFPISIRYNSQKKDSFELRVARVQPEVVVIGMPLKTPPVSRSVVPVSPKRPSSTKRLTVEDVYRMIIRNEFYCHSQNDDYHRQVLEKLRKSERMDSLDSVNWQYKKQTNGNFFFSYTFKSDWALSALSKDNIVQTDSSKRKARSGVITLLWAPQKMEKVTYRNALKKVEILNNSKSGGFSDWRIPTLEEFFLIVDDKFASRNFFPFNYRDLFSQTIKIWTSNLADENEKNRLVACYEDAYFTINNTHKRNYDGLGFDVTCSREKAYLLPVRSGNQSSPPRIITATTSRSSKPPRKTPRPPSLPLKRIHIARLPYWDANKRKILDTVEAKLVNDTVLKMIEKWALVSNKKTAINSTFPGIKKNVKKIIDITFDRFLPPEKRFKKINKKVKIPDYVDVIVTGKYFDAPNSNNVTICPIVILRYKKEILTKNILLDKYDMVCSDPFTKKKVLCLDARRKIEQEIAQLLSFRTGKIPPSQKIISKPPPHPPSHKSLFVTHLTIMDSLTQFSVAGLGELVDEAILTGIQRAERSTGVLAVNRKNHHIANTNDNVHKLAETLFETGLTKRSKIKQIINDFMIPNHVDVIVTGLYIGDSRGASITLRPMVIVKYSRKILSKNLQFKRDELLCDDPSGHRKILCQRAFNKIAEAVKDLLEQI